MIISGDTIEMTIGATLGISTLGAAALGNVIADVLGLNLGGLIEEISYKFGIPEPQISKEQMDMGVTKTVAVSREEGGGRREGGGKGLMLWYRGGHG